MNPPVLYESFIIGAKEGLKAGAVLIVFHSFLYFRQRQHLIKPLYAGLILTSILTLPFLFLAGLAIVKDYIRSLISLSFAIIFLVSGLSLIHKTGTDLLFPLKAIIKGEVRIGSRILSASILFLTVFFFLPDSAGSALFLRDYSIMKETLLGAYIPALSGFLMVISGALFLLRFEKVKKIGIFFDLPQFFLFLAMVKLLGGGIKGFAELSLIPSVQRGFMKFIHDLIHQVFVMLMVPDHQLLKTTVWNFIGFFFGPNVASAMSLFLLLFLPILFIYNSLFRTLPEPSVIKRAEARMVKFRILSERRRRAIPVFIYILFILFSWFSGSGEGVSRLYNPVPRPVVSDKGIILIPINDPTMNLFDGSLHKFSLNLEGEDIRLLIIKRSDDSLAVCLDACEICPPVGYGQQENQVVCIYCKTPIPIDTLGEKGGCNPIPLAYLKDDSFIRIELQEILKKWQYVKTGKGRESVK
jgi:hypothetical protein